MIFLTANIEVNGKTIKSNSSGVTESKKGGELRQKRALRIYDRALAITTLFISRGCFKKSMLWSEFINLSCSLNSVT